MPLLKTVTSLAAAATFLVGAELKIGTAPVVTHEWGTFTSVAREDGAAEWAPLLGPGDLPCFVTRAQEIRKVAVVPFGPGFSKPATGKWQISTAGGAQPRWSPRRRRRLGFPSA
jgi:hypothetical protein